jgi:hypothetical protein
MSSRIDHFLSPPIAYLNCFYNQTPELSTRRHIPTSVSENKNILLFCHCLSAVGRQGFTSNDNSVNQNLAILRLLINGFGPIYPSQKGIGYAMSILRSEFANFLRMVYAICFMVTEVRDERKKI